jgi:hypothetical protein
MTDKTKEFLEKLKVSGKWNDDYDYSEVEYANINSPVVIINKKYNSKHLIRPTHILNRGTGCSIHNAIDKDLYFKLIAKECHGDRYGYDLIKYTKANDYVNIVCKKHGVFKQRAHGHLQGKGCSKCRGFTLNNKEIIKQFREIHGELYDYSLVEYEGGHKKVKIICPLHGEFEQFPSGHKNGTGCPKCNGGVKKNAEDFIYNAKLKHGNLYDYRNISYINSDIDIEIICKTHGKFKQRPSHHLNGSGCPKCVGKYKTSDDFISEARLIHGEYYDYSLLEYKRNNSEVIIKCPIHGIFKQIPSNHLQGNGCSICSGRGWLSKYKLQLLDDLSNSDLLNMDPFELSVIIGQGKLPMEFRDLLNTDANSDERITTLQQLKERFNEEVDEEVETIINSTFNDEFIEIDSIDGEITNTREEVLSLPQISSVNDLQSLDNSLYATMDEEAFESLIQYKLRKLWNSVLNDETTVDTLRVSDGGKYFNQIKGTFLSEYESVCNYLPPVGYSFPHQPNLMQKLSVSRLVKNKTYGNWSGTGAGKTLAFIIASREIDARLTLIIAINSTIKQTCKYIKSVYPNSEVFTEYNIDYKFDKNKHNYLVLNYEKFQQTYSEELFQSLTNNNIIDFVVIDEVHNAKQLQEDNESIRRGVLNRLMGRIREKNPNLFTSVMSATPVINNLFEAKSLLSLMTGLEYEDINTRRTLPNALKVFQQLILNGLRYIPKYDISVSELTSRNRPNLNIDGSHLMDALLALPRQDFIAAEKLLLPDKLNAIKPELKQGTILYTYYTTDIVDLIKDFVVESGFTVGTYTGEESSDLRNETLNKFINGDIDILIGSKPIATGVDGLQDICNRMILLTLPWTDAEYTQLKGRVYRQGSKFNNVEFIIPQIKIDLGENEIWSWDIQRLNLIKNKRTLADAAVDGIIPSKILPSPTTMFSKSKESLDKWKERIKNGNIIESTRNLININLYPEILNSENRVQRMLSEFSELNKTWSITRSDNTHERLIKDPSEWYYYHTLYSESRKSWPEIPYIEIAKKLKDRPEWIVGDFGCGENLLSKEIKNKVHAFDHVAIDNNVIACDIKNVPLEGNTLDVAVFSLSLMGSNYTDYFKEAYRTLKPYGNIFICEPASKWSGREEDLKNILESVGFKCFGAIRNSDKFIYIDGVKY